MVINNNIRKKDKSIKYISINNCLNIVNSFIYNLMKTYYRIKKYNIKKYNKLFNNI